LISNPERSLLLGAMDGTKTGKFYGDPFGQYVSTLRAVGEKFGINYSVAWNDLDELGKQLALLGTGQDIHEVTWDYKRAERSGKHHFKGRWDGFIALVNEEYKRKHADHRGLEMIPVMKTETCPSCMGSRLCSEALGYRLGGLTIAELSELPVSEVLVFFAGLGSLIADPLEIASAGPLIAEILHRLETISLLGLSYLPISRASSGLSGGEAHRIRLASQIGSGLTGITYILDEPTVGLHPADTHRLMRMIRKLKDAGNTVIAVEHDPEVILSADHVIDIGPGAGMNGGRILFSGHPEQMLTDEGSVTGRYLREPISGSASRNRLLREGIQIRNARVHNLKGFDLSVPAGGIVAVTGVSGSGKSSLVFDLIYASWNRQHPAGCEAISGFGQFSRIQAIQQQSFFTSSSGTPVTYTGIFDLIRDLFAKTTEARKKGLKKSSFSFHDKNGRCDRCRGTGQVRIGMDFLSDVNIPCENCRGKRYRDAILECRYRGKDIASVLDMTVSEASAFFEDNRKITGRLAILDKVGLGYLRLGQSLDTLSGGEAQRLVLAAELILPEKEETLYLFEEPSTGLHFQDIRHLMTLFHELADKGNSLLIVEHDPLVIREADWIIDLGPEGGDNGGFVVAQGRLEEILLAKNSLTGEHLRELFRK
jgi:excinuclease ABC subunit A